MSGSTYAVRCICRTEHMPYTYAMCNIPYALENLCLHGVCDNIIAYVYGVHGRNIVPRVYRV